MTRYRNAPSMALRPAPEKKPCWPSMERDIPRSKIRGLRVMVGGWVAFAEIYRLDLPFAFENRVGPTPAAALRALTEALRERS